MASKRDHRLDETLRGVPSPVIDRTYEQGLRDAAEWLDEEYARLCGARDALTGDALKHTEGELACLADLCGAFRFWSKSGRPPQHRPDCSELKFKLKRGKR